MSEKLRTAAPQELVGRLGKGLIWLITSFFALNVLALIAAVVVNSFSTR